MMNAVIFDSVDAALAALNRMFRGLEAVVEDGGEHFLVGVIRTADDDDRRLGCSKALGIEV